eukprot:2391881-Amphidinium_carterae.1
MRSRVAEGPFKSATKSHSFIEKPYLFFVVFMFAFSIATEFSTPTMPNYLKLGRVLKFMVAVWLCHAQKPNI